jgi:hypothetical protein
MQIDELTLHWLAGLLEGEGSFCMGTSSHPGKPYIAIQMSDEDVIAKVAAIWGTRYHVSCPKRSLSNGWHSIYATRLTGRRAVRLMLRLRSLMGQRRQVQITEALASHMEDARRVLTVAQLEELRRRALNGENMLELASEYGISRSLAYHIKNGYTYKMLD